MHNCNTIVELSKSLLVRWQAQDGNLACWVLTSGGYLGTGVRTHNGDTIIEVSESRNRWMPRVKLPSDRVKAVEQFLATLDEVAIEEPVLPGWSS